MTRVARSNLLLYGLGEVRLALRGLGEVRGDRFGDRETNGHPVDMKNDWVPSQLYLRRTSVCMYVCMFVCMYAFLYVCMQVCVIVYA